MATILQQFLRREAHPLVQFIKYGLAGGLATAVDMVLFYILSLWVFPALTSDDKFVTLFQFSITPVDEDTRLRHFLINRVICFMVSNFTAYVANVLWVFESGRHSRTKELVLFYVVSGTSFIIGTGLAAALIRYFGFSTTVAYVANMFSSVMINYVCRKFIIFKG